MACELTKSATKVCSTSIGGIEKFYFANREDIDFDGLAQNEQDGITAIPLKSGKEWFVFDLNEDTGSILVELVIGGNQNKFYNQTVTFANDGLGLATILAFEELVLAKTVAVGVTRNGERLVTGLENGLRSSEYQNATGAATDDESGHNITLVAPSRTTVRPLAEDVVLPTAA